MPRKRRITVNLDHCQYPLVFKAVQKAGWRVAKRGQPFDIGWSDSNHIIREIGRMHDNPRLMSPIQRFNHLLQNQQLHSKDHLATNMSALQDLCPEHFDFSPRSFVLPRDMAALQQHYKEEDGKTYIVKPPSGMQGQGIELCLDPVDWFEKSLGKSIVIQEYIARPLLIEGAKFDLRLYVLVLSVSPLQIYLYGDGLVRLCTEEYEAPTEHNLDNSHAHLTNYSLNKFSKAFQRCKAEDEGHKRSIRALFEWFEAEGIDGGLVWQDVIRVVNLTVIGTSSLLSSAYSKFAEKHKPLSGGASQSLSFEILGFDVMIDDQLKVWLIEINHMPSFKGDSTLDAQIKNGVIRGALKRLKVDISRRDTLNARIQKVRELHTIQMSLKAAAAQSAARCLAAARRQPIWAAAPSLAGIQRKVAASREESSCTNVSTQPRRNSATAPSYLSDRPKSVSKSRRDSSDRPKSSHERPKSGLRDRPKSSQQNHSLVDAPELGVESPDGAENGNVSSEAEDEAQLSGDEDEASNHTIGAQIAEGAGKRGYRCIFDAENAAHVQQYSAALRASELYLTQFNHPNMTRDPMDSRQSLVSESE